MQSGVCKYVLGLAGLVFALTSLFSGQLVHAEEPVVDLALVLALDCSASVDTHEFALQMEGLGRAFQRQEVREAIQGGALKRIAVSVVQWSGKDNQVTVLPWTVIANDDDAKRVGAEIAHLQLMLEPSGTSISSALLYADTMLDEAPRAGRQVIDLSADGPNNVGPDLAEVRDVLVAKGIIINALTLRNEWRNLNIYFKREVTGGIGSFVVPARDYEDYADAIYKKLVKEITGPGVS